MAIVYTLGMFSVMASEAVDDNMDVRGWKKVKDTNGDRYVTDNLELVIPQRRHAVGVTKARLDRLAANPCR